MNIIKIVRAGSGRNTMKNTLSHIFSVIQRRYAIPFLKQLSEIALTLKAAAQTDLYKRKLG